MVQKSIEWATKFVRERLPRRPRINLTSYELRALPDWIDLAESFLKLVYQGFQDAPVKPLLEARAQELIEQYEERREDVSVEKLESLVREIGSTVVRVQRPERIGQDLWYYHDWRKKIESKYENRKKEIEEILGKKVDPQTRENLTQIEARYQRLIGIEKRIFGESPNFKQYVQWARLMFEYNRISQADSK